MKASGDQESVIYWYLESHIAKNNSPKGGG